MLGQALAVIALGVLCYVLGYVRFFDRKLGGKMIKVRCGDGSNEEYATIEDLNRELEQSASDGYRERVIRGLRERKFVAVPNGPDEIDEYEITGE